MTKEAAIAWAAGFFEGEGSITIAPDLTLIVRASQVDRTPLERFVALFGGTIRDKCARGNRKKCWEWNCCGPAAAGLLTLIRPYIVRPRIRERIELALTFQAMKPDRATARHRRSELKALYDVFKQLNKQGL